MISKTVVVNLPADAEARPVAVLVQLSLIHISAPTRPS